MTTTNRHAITGVRLTSPNGVLDDRTVVVEDGLITDVTTGPAPEGATDGAGMLLLPGLVDCHSDGLERERSPRRTASFPLDFALLTFEGRLAAAGITTVFHGIGFQDNEKNGRSLALADASCQAIEERRGSAPVDHRLLVRTEARSENGPHAALPWIERFTEPGPDGETVVPIVSFEDHSPGQGQYRNVDQFRAAIDPATLPDGETVDSYVAARLAEAEAAQHLRATNREQLRALAVDGRIRLLAHDCESPDDVDEAHAASAAVAEFPLTVDAARRARALGMQVVMGAPNAMRGRSHSGNASAAEVVAHGLCDALASDYQPATMLAAAFSLVAHGTCSLHDAVGLITEGPARTVGLSDRGTVAVGRRADLVLVDDAGRWPQVHHAWRAPTTLRPPVTA